MTLQLEDFYNRLQEQPGVEKKLPPVDEWNPDLSGDIAIVINAQGHWFHDGALIRRQPLVNLFSSILKREGDDYFLVTPVEKWRIQVAVAPLMIVDCRIDAPATVQQVIHLKTQQNHWFAVNTEHAIFSRLVEQKSYPLAHVRSGLNALIERTVYYELAEYIADYGDAALPEDASYYASDSGGCAVFAGQKAGQYGLLSSGCFFPLSMG